jgi:hypothetical protein
MASLTAIRARNGLKIKVLACLDGHLDLFDHVLQMNARRARTLIAAGKAICEDEPSQPSSAKSAGLLTDRAAPDNHAKLTQRKQACQTLSVH